MDLQKLEQIKALRAKYRVGESDEKAFGTGLAAGIGASYLAGKFAAPLIHKIGKHAGEVYRDLKEQVGKGGRVERSINEGKPLNEIPHSDPKIPTKVRARKVDSIPTVTARKVPDVPPLLTLRKDRKPASEEKITPGAKFTPVKPLTTEERERRAERIILPKMAESRRQGFRGPGSSPNTRKGSIYGQVKKPSTGKLDLSALRSGDNQMEYDLTGSKPTMSFQAPRKEGATHSEKPNVKRTAADFTSSADKPVDIPEKLDVHSEHRGGDVTRSGGEIHRLESAPKESTYQAPPPVRRETKDPLQNLTFPHHRRDRAVVPYVSPKGSPPSSTRSAQPSPVQEGQEESGPVLEEGQTEEEKKAVEERAEKRRKATAKGAETKQRNKVNRSLQGRYAGIRSTGHGKTLDVDVEEKAMDIDTKAAKKKPLPAHLQGLPRKASTTRGTRKEGEGLGPLTDRPLTAKQRELEGTIGAERQVSRPLTRAEQKLVRGPRKATDSSKQELPRGTVNLGPLARTVNETPEQIATINRANAEIEARERAGKPKKMGKREGQQLARNAPRGTSTTVGGRLKEGVRYDKEGNIQPQKYYGVHSQQAGQAPKRGSKPHDIPDVPLGSGHGKIDLGVDYARSHVGKQEQEERPFSKPLKEASYGRVSHRAHPHLSGSVASTPLAHPTGTIDVSGKRPAKASMRVVSGMTDEPRTSQHGRDVEGEEEFVARGSPHYPQAIPVQRDNRLANAARKVGGAIARGAGAVASRLGLVGSMKLGRERKAPELVQGPQQPKDRKPQGMTISRNYGRALSDLGTVNQGESEQEKANRAAMQSTTRKIAEAGMQQHRPTRLTTNVGGTPLISRQTGYQPSQSFTHSKAGKTTSEGYNAAQERMKNNMRERPKKRPSYAGTFDSQLMANLDQRAAHRAGKHMTIQNKADSFADRIGLVKAARRFVGPMPDEPGRPVSSGVGRATYAYPKPRGKKPYPSAPVSTGKPVSAYYPSPAGEETGPRRANERNMGRSYVATGGNTRGEAVGIYEYSHLPHPQPLKNERIRRPVNEINFGGRTPPVQRMSARQQERLMINPKGRRIFPQESKFLSNDQTRAEKFMGRLARKNQDKSNVLGSLGASGGLESMAALI